MKGWRKTPSVLGGIRVLELSSERVQYLGKLLGDMGADVIKVEPPGGDACRRRGPFYSDVPDANRSLYFWQYNTSKRGVTLDLAAPEGREIARRLASRADIVLEGFKPGYLQSLNLDHEALSASNPRLIMASVTPFGQTGPWKDFQASDLIHLALGGSMASSGYEDPTAPPMAGGGGQSLHVAGQFTYCAILAALLERDRSGRGQYIDCSIHEACSVTTETAVPTWIYRQKVLYRQTGRHATAARDAPLQFRCGDGTYINTIMPQISDARWRIMVQWFAEYGVAEDLGDQRWLDPVYRQNNWGRAAEVMGRFIARFPSGWLYHQAQGKGLSWGMVRAPEENLSDPGLQERGFFVTVEHPEVGATLPYPGSPHRSDEAPWRISRRAPLLGEHNHEVYCLELGYAKEQLTALAETGVI